MKKAKPLDLQIRWARGLLAIDGEVPAIDEELVLVVAMFLGAQEADKSAVAREVTLALSYYLMVKQEKAVLDKEYERLAGQPALWDEQHEEDIEQARQRWIRQLMLWYGANGREVRQCDNCQKYYMPFRGSLFCERKCAVAYRTRKWRQRKNLAGDSDVLSES